MYRRCLFCRADLGTNQVIEPFPVGRRLAFDTAKGRLWVVCRHCERWNLTPLEERWEAVEEAERLFRETPLRVSTENVGLARHREGLDLVRIGAPLRPEFAGWRYGDQFGRRRRRFIAYSVVGAGVVAGLGVGSVALTGGFVGLNLGMQSFNLLQLVRFAGAYPGARIRLMDGGLLEVGTLHLGTVTIRPGSGDGTGPLPGGWHLSLSHKGGKAILSGQDAVRALRVLLPKVNLGGASGRQVQAAIRELEEVGGPEAYFSQAEYRARRQGWGYMNLGRLPASIRLALEMAANEDAERIALEGELSWLEGAWREAEEIAAIADELTLPERVRIRFEELRARHGRLPAD